MRATIALDDDLLEKAQALTNLKALIERESAKRLALLGGNEPDLTTIPRRQSAV